MMHGIPAPAGVPTVVGKRMMQQGLVGRIVTSAQAAATAAADGANLVLLTVCMLSCQRLRPLFNTGIAHRYADAVYAWVLSGGRRGKPGAPQGVCGCVKRTIGSSSCSMLLCRCQTTRYRMHAWHGRAAAHGATLQIDTRGEHVYLVYDPWVSYGHMPYRTWAWVRVSVNN